ncbi:hypothetical protein LCGC14_2349020, partial [marine sediment metagenome]
VDPNSQILRSDLTWAPADEIRAGDELLAFDENVVERDRKFRAAIVLGVKKIALPRVRVYTTQGTVIVSAQHPFLAERPAYSDRYWTQARKLKPGARIAYLTSPWETDTSWSGAYLAGFFDGEGWCTKMRVGFGQNRGPTLDYVQELLLNRGFHFNLTPAWKPGSKAIRPGKTQMRGDLSSMREALRFLGTIRPPRLLLKARAVWEGRRTGGKGGVPVARVITVEPLSIGEVIAIKTSTGTYISDGMFSHNSAVQTEFLLKFKQNPKIYPCLRLIVHDEIASLVRKNMVDYAIEEKHKVMTAPIPALDGLSFGAEVSVGPSLGELEVVRT